MRILVLLDVPEELNLQSHCCENFKSLYVRYYLLQMKDWLGTSLLVFMGWCGMEVLASQWEGQQKGFSWLARKKETHPRDFS